MTEEVFLYNETTVSVSDIEFVVFSDDGFINKGTYDSENHFHKGHEVIYCYQGTLEIFYDQKKYQVGKGDMVIIAKDIVHSLHMCEDTYYVALFFWENNKWNNTEGITIFKNFPARDAFERIFAYHSSGYKYKKELIRSCIHEIITMMLEVAEVDGEIPLPITLEHNNYRRYIIEQFFLSRFCDSPKVSELAELLHLSVQQTQRLVKKMYHKTFREQLAFFRVDKAKTMLVETNLKTTEISRFLGYSNAHNFFRLFKNLEGMTPAQYRKQFEKKALKS